MEAWGHFQIPASWNMGMLGHRLGQKEPEAFASARIRSHEKTTKLPLPEGVYLAALFFPLW